MKKIATLTALLIISLISQAQYQPKKIKSKENYIHNPTNIIFPLYIDKYIRTDIYAFDKQKTNIGTTYTNDNTYFTIYVYPAGDGTEDRLRSEYLNSLQSIADLSETGIDVTQNPTSYKNSDYKINGFKAEIKNKLSHSEITVFECGTWFFKTRITSENLDSAELSTLNTRILDIFNPTVLVKQTPLNHKANISFARAAFTDSIMLGSVMGSAFKKIEWALTNVDSLERESGFPGLYLGLHTTSILELVEFEKKHPNYSKSKRTTEYLLELNNIISSGYLEEFIMEQYSMVMITPDNLQLDWDNFKKWKITNPISINLNHLYYVISYSADN